jgi:hypothetical protein
LTPPVAGQLQVVGDRIAFVHAGLQPATGYTVAVGSWRARGLWAALGSPLRWQLATGPVQVLFTRTEGGREQLFVAPLPLSCCSALPGPPPDGRDGGSWTSPSTRRCGGLPLQR